MQTFMPYPDFVEVAKVLDNRRLGKQRVETWQIYLSLTKPDYGWKNHPIVKMWKGHERTLLIYGMSICIEWRKRGFKDTMLRRFLDEFKLRQMDGNCPFLWDTPEWIYNKELNKSHQSNLLRKDFVYYSKFFKDVPSDLPYIWTV